MAQKLVTKNEFLKKEAQAVRTGGASAPPAAAPVFLPKSQTGLTTKDAFLKKEMQSIQLGSALTEKDAIKTETGFKKWTDSIGKFQNRVLREYDSRGDGYQSSSEVNRDASSIKSEATYLKEQADVYRNYFKKYKDVYGEEQVSAILKDLDEAEKYLDSVRDVATDDSKYWSQWKSEGEYHRTMEYDDVLQKSRDAYTTKTPASTKYTDEEIDKQIADAKTQIGKLEQEITQFKVGSSRGGYGTNFDAAITSRQKEIDALNKSIRDLENQKQHTDLDSLQQQRDEIVKKIKDLQSQAPTGEAGWRSAAASGKTGELGEQAQEIKDLQEQLKSLETKIEGIELVQKFDGKKYEDTFGGNVAANYRIGDLYEISNKAWGEWATNRAPEQKEFAETVDAIIAQMEANNVETLKGDEWHSWVSKDLANYMPQFLRTLKSQAVGTTVGGLLGAAAGNPVLGAKAGAIAATGVHSAQTMRGAAFRALRELPGVSEETAIQMANDEAIINAMIEMADTGIDIMTLGGWGKLTDLIGKGAKKWAGNNGMKQLAVALAKYGINIGSEGFEEGLQGIVSTANQRRAMAGEDAGFGALLGDSAKLAGDVLTGKDAEARAQFGEEFKGGAKIAAMMGGMDAAVTAGGTAMRLETTGANIRKAQGDNYLIEKALNLDASTDAYKFAAALDKRGADAKITNRDLGKLASLMPETEAVAQTAEVQEQVEAPVAETPQSAVQAEPEAVKTPPLTATKAAKAADPAVVEMTQSSDPEVAAYAEKQVEVGKTATVASPVAQNLMNAGVSAKVATEQGNIIQKIAAGQEITPSEQKTLNLADPRVREAFSNATGVAVASGSANTTAKKKAIIKSAQEVAQRKESLAKTEAEMRERARVAVAEALAAEQANATTQTTEAGAAPVSAEAEAWAGEVMDAAVAEATADPTVKFSDGTVLTKSEFIKQYKGSPEKAARIFDNYRQYNNQGRLAPASALRHSVSAETESSENTNKAEMSEEDKQLHERAAARTVEQLDAIAKKKWNASVELKDLGPDGGNGYYDPNTRTVVLNSQVCTSQRAVSFYFLHEATHLAGALSKMDAKVANTLTKDIVSAIDRLSKGVDTVDKEVKRLRPAYAKHLGVPAEEIGDAYMQDEVACNFMMLAFQHRELLDRLCGINPSIAQSIIRVLTPHRKEFKEVRKLIDRMRKSMEAAETKKGQESTDTIENRESQEYNGSEIRHSAKGYWYPKLTKSEWKLLEYRMNREIEDPAFDIDGAKKWLFADEKGTAIFAIYGVGDGTVPTPLYASGGKRARKDGARWMEFWEGEKNDADRESFNSWAESFRGEQRKHRFSVHDAAGRGPGVADDQLAGGERGGVRGRDNGQGPENSRGELRYSVPNDYAPTYYSQMERVVQGMKQAKFGASSVVSMLRGRGVKAEEIKWSGVEQWLEGKKSVTKDELLEFIAGSELQIEETEKRQDGEGEFEYMSMETGEVGDLDYFYSRAAEIAEEMGYDPEDVRYDGYEENGFFYVNDRSAEDGYVELLGLEQTAWRDETRWGKYKLDGGSNYRELVFQMPGSDYTNRAMQAHWGDDAEGVLAHARMQDFETEDGKMLFIEEIQSDWHNAGARSGYGKELTVEEKAAGREKAREKLMSSEAGREVLSKIARHNQVSSEEYQNRGVEAGYEFLEADPHNTASELLALYPYWMNEERTRAIGEYLEDIDHLDNKPVPDAPFAKNYHEYVLKRLIRMAAEEGYDSIGWTTAQQQVDRWSEDYAEGYRIEYDQDIPKFLSKYGKQWGARVGQTALPGTDYALFQDDIKQGEADIAEWEAELAEAETDSQREFIQGQIDYIRDEIKRLQAGGKVWTMPITDAMKQSVLYEGQPRYSINADGDPAELTIQDRVREIAKTEDLDAAIDLMLQWMTDVEAGKLQTRSGEERYRDLAIGTEPLTTKQKRDASKIISEAMLRYGRLPTGEKPAKKVPFPKKMDKETAVNKYVQTVAEAETTPKEIRDFIKVCTANKTDGFTHEIATDRAAMTHVRKMWNDKQDDFDELLKQWNAIVLEKRMPSKKDVAFGESLLIEAATRAGKGGPDAQKYVGLTMSLIAEIASVGTQAGQIVQSLRLLKKMGPAGQLYATQQMVDRLNRDWNKRRKNKNVEKAGAKRVKDDSAAAVDRARRNVQRSLSDLNNIPVEQWMTEVGNNLANQLASRLNTDPKVRTTTQTILSDLTKFAMEHSLPTKKGQTRTAVDVLRDYFANKDAYTEAWNQARRKLKEQFADNPDALDAFDSFIGGTIDYNGDPLHTQSVILSALLTEIRNQKMDKARMIDLAAIGLSDKMINSLADKLVDQTGVTGVNETILRDAIRRNVIDRYVSEADGKRLAGILQKSAKDVAVGLNVAKNNPPKQGVFVRNVAEMSKRDREAAFNSIVNRLVSKYGATKEEAQVIAATVRDTFNATVLAQAEAQMAAIFRTKGEHVRPEFWDQFRKYANLGVFDSRYAMDGTVKLTGVEGVTIKEEYAQAILDAETDEELEAAKKALILDLAEQAPVSLAEKWNTLRYTAMLLNPTTHLRNFGSNLAFTPAMLAKDMFAAILESPMLLFGKRDAATKHLGLAFSNIAYTLSFGTVKLTKYEKFAASDFKSMAEEVKRNGKYTPKQEILEKRHIYGKYNPMRYLSEGNSKLLDFEDVIFMNRAYVNAMAQFLAVHKVDVASLKDGSDMLERARAYAIKEARRATYREASKLANALSRLEQTGGIFAQLGIGALVPFKQTPVNVLKTGVSYSPLSILTSIPAEAVKLKRGEITAADFIDTFAQGLTGTGIFALGYWMASQGLLRATGAADEKEKEFEELQGDQEYSIILGDDNYVLSWLAPFALPLFTGAELFEKVLNSEDIEVADVLDVALLVAEPMFSLSMLDSLNSTLDSISYAENKAAALAAEAVMSYFGQVNPTLAKKIARGLDGTRRATYVDKNSDVPGDIQRAFQRQFKDYMGEDAAMYLDAWGRSDTAGNKVLGFLDELLNPAYHSVKRTSAMEEELLRVYKLTGDGSVLPKSKAKSFKVDKKDYNLSKDEWETYQMVAGQADFEMQTRLTESASYQSLPLHLQLKAINMVHEYTDEKGKEAAVSAYATDKSWIAKADKLTDAGLSVEDYIAQYVISAEVDGGYTKDVLGMNWLSDEHKALLVSSAYGKLVDSDNTFDDPFSDVAGKRYTLTDEQVKQCEDHYEELWLPEYNSLVSSKKFTRASLQEQADMVDKLKQDVAKDNVKWMARQLRQQGIRSAKKN